jgi:hypothetical protein
MNYSKLYLALGNDKMISIAEGEDWHPTNATLV